MFWDVPGRGRGTSGVGHGRFVSRVTSPGGGIEETGVTERGPRNLPSEEVYKVQSRLDRGGAIFSKGIGRNEIGER